VVPWRRWPAISPTQRSRSRFTASRSASVKVLSAAGEIAQVDFGYVGRLYDAAAGVLRRAWVFVMVLAYGRHLFAPERQRLSA
jgi:hypothetical protein